jgi:hypothetical protein
MENITHAQFQLIIGLIGAIGFFAFAGLVYFLDILTTNNKNK